MALEGRARAPSASGMDGHLSKTNRRVFRKVLILFTWGFFLSLKGKHYVFSYSFIAIRVSGGVSVAQHCHLLLILSTSLLFLHTLALT